MAKRKFRYDDGGAVEMEEGSGGYGALPEAEPAAEKPKTFKEAFAEARKAGDKTFTFGGKKYTTETAGASRSSPTPSSAPSPAPAPSTQRVEVTGKRAPKDDESKSVSERMKAARERARAGGTSTDERSVTERMGGFERKGSSTSTDTRSLAERARAMRESARSGSSGTDTRSVSERIRGALGFAKGGSVRGDGCAQRGKTKGRFV